ncbi:guanine deaminase isoform X1 [Schistocerca americana]|uniref:guanine deaminase isoform X1 n=1 Tax=Schistocerca americana TaxID=7009 RepID=UPI001F502EB5|nr:guanine deaminase isoform X1 [Schistocerca americana]XP_046982474.1 guanine deaminase isoform X1 [Schistocerca americana]
MQSAGGGKQNFDDLPSTFAIVGTIVHSTELSTITVIENGVLHVADGKIVSVGSGGDAPEGVTTVRLTSNQFLMPGLIDSHIHAPQYPNMGLGYDKTLLDWLDTYTYPMETKYSDVEFAQTVYRKIVERTLQCGTTTACYFTTIHPETALLLAQEAAAQGQRALVGKVCMNVNAPDNYTETTEQSVTSTQQFVQDVANLGCDLVKPVITPRFAISCDMELMTKLGKLAQQNNLHVQSHISENEGEVQTVAEMYPNCANYAEVYDKAGLLTSKTVMAHGVLLKPEEVALLKERGTSISHCPTSNINLRSGVCPVRTLLQSGLTVGLGTDVSGGSTESLLDVMRSALSVSVQKGFDDSSQQPLSYKEVFYLATMGGANALSMGNEVGCFKAGMHFDALVVDLNAGPGTVVFEDLPLKPLEMVQKFIYCGDDRNITAVFVEGRELKATAAADVRQFD